MKKTSNKQLLFVIPAIMGFAVSQAQNAPESKEPGNQCELHGQKSKAK